MKTTNQTITQERLKELLHYDPLTGLFTRSVYRSPNAKAGDVAGGDNGRGYIKINVDGVSHYAHRLVWLYVHGKFPDKNIDHINGNTFDNRVSNLRDVQQGINLQNQKQARSDNKSCGLLGVSRDKSKWSAQISTDKKLTHLGNFPTPELAHEAYLAAKRQHHEGNTL